MTTLKKLKESPAQRIRNKFHDHPLLLTCQQVFRHYMAEMNSFDFTSEDLFIEVANVIDSIFDNPSFANEYIEEMWDNLKIELKTRENPAPPQEDLNTVCGVLFYIVAAVLSLHWRENYNTKMVKQLCKIVEQKAIFSKNGEQEEIINNLCKNAEGLEDWINEYDESEEWLSDEIEKVNTQQLRADNKTDKPEFNPITTTFLKAGTVLDANITLVFQQLLKYKWIAANSNPDAFYTLFSGKASEMTIVWMKAKGLLHDLFKMLIDEKLITCPDGYGYLQIVSSHFTDEKGNYLINLNSGYKGKKIQANLSHILILMKTKYHPEDD